MNRRSFLAASSAMSTLAMLPVAARAVQTGPAPAATPTPAAAADAAIITQPWPGPFGGVPQWDRIRPAMFPAAFQAAMDATRREVHAVRDNPARPTFQNTI